MTIVKRIDEAVFKFEFCHKKATLLYVGEREAEELREHVNRITGEEGYLDVPSDHYGYESMRIVLVSEESHLAVGRLPEEN